MSPRSSFNRDRDDSVRSFELTDEEKEIEDDRLFAFRRGSVYIDPCNTLTYNPGDRQRIPKKGAWVRITRRLPPIEGNIDEHVRVGRVFWAEHDVSADDEGFLPNGTYKLKLTTEWGDVWIMPYEYSRVDTDEILMMWQEGALIFHPLRTDLARFNEVVYYCRSRGMPLGVAAVMALGSVDANIGWFELEASLAEWLEAVEDRIHRWNPSKSPRTLKTPMNVEIVVDDQTKQTLTVRR